MKTDHEFTPESGNSCTSCSRSILDPLKKERTEIEKKISSGKLTETLITVARQICRFVTKR